MANLDAILKISAKGDASGLAGLSAGIKGIQKAGEQANSALGGMGKMLGSVTGGVLALGAGLSAAGVVAFAKGAIDAADNMRDLSQKTGVSVENLSRFQQAAQMAGTDVEAVGKGLVKLGRNMVEAATTGKGPAAEALNYLGISAVDATGKLKSADQVMLEVADKFQRMPDGARKAQLAIDLLGKSGADIIPMLNGGRQAIEGLAASMSTEFSDKADAYNDSLAATQAVFGQIGMEIANQLLPYLSSAVDWISRVGIGFRDYIVANKEPIRQTIEVIGGIVKAIGPWILGIGGVIAVYKVLTETLKGLAVAQAVIAALQGPGGWVKLAAAVAIGGGAVLGLNMALKGTQTQTSDAELEARKLAESLKRGKTEAESIEPPIENAKAKQEAFRAAVDQSNYSYQLLGATVDATSQAVDRQSKLKAATLDADIVVNNAAKTLLEIKLGQAKTDGERAAILRQIQGLEVENARIQQRAQNLQIDSEIRQASYRAQKEKNQLAQIQNEYKIAQAMGEQTAALAQQLRLQAIKAKDAEAELALTKAIANEKRRGIQAETDAKIAQAQAKSQSAVNYGSASSASAQSGGSALPSGSYVTAPNGAQVYDEGGGRISVVTSGTRSQMGIDPAESALAWYRKNRSYAGGGYTGDAPRSGGLDGRGGFMAMLHPRETVVDHTQAGGGVPNITIKTGEVLQLPDGSQWVSMGDLEQAMAATAAGIMGQLRTPAGRMALRGA